MNRESALITKFLAHLEHELNLSRATISAYRSDIMELQQYALQKLSVNLTGLQTQAIQDFLDSKTLAARSIARKISAWKQFYNFIRAEGIILVNPTKDLRTLKADPGPLFTLKPAEVEKMISHAMLDQSEKGRRNYAMLSTLLASGLRISELVSIKLRDISTPMGVMRQITVCGKGNKERVVLIDQRAQEAIVLYLNNRTVDSPWLFPGTGTKPLTRQSFFIILKKMATAVGLDPSYVFPHQMRKCFATHLLRKGMDIRLVQELLGHANITSTEIYEKTTPNELYDELLMHHPIKKLIV